jgi:hypothetical protein
VGKAAKTLPLRKAHVRLGRHSAAGGHGGTNAVTKIRMPRPPLPTYNHNKTGKKHDCAALDADSRA